MIQGQLIYKLKFPWCDISVNIFPPFQTLHIELASCDASSSFQWNTFEIPPCTFFPSCIILAVKRSLHLIAIYPPRPPSVRRSEKFLHLAAAVFLCICNGLQLRFICAQKFQGTSLFLWTAEEWVQLGFISRSLLPNFSTAFSPPPIPISRPHSRSWWPINLSTTNGSVAKICEQRFGSWFADFLARHLFKAKGVRLAPYKAELAN